MSRTFVMDGLEVEMPVECDDAEADEDEACYEDEGEGNFDSDLFQAAEEEVEAPVMPTEYYQSVEYFLSRAPPKLQGSTSDKEKRKKKPDASDEKPPPVLPQITKNSRADGSSKPKVQSKVSASIKGTAKAGPTQRNIDPNLLMQAFAYTDQLVREAEEEEAKGGSAPHMTRPPLPGSDQSNHPRSAPYDLDADTGGSQNQKGGNGGRQKSKKKGGVVKKLRTQTQNAGFSVPVMAEEDHQKAAMDFDSLVANFQQGITLQKLQSELAASQQSMKQSEDFMKQLTREFGGGRRR